MVALVLKLTDAGLAAVQGHAGSDQAVIAELGLTATPFDYAPTLTALPGQFKRIANIAGEAAAPNISHLTAYDTSQDAWTATGLGLFLADGTLFAVHSSPETVLSKASAAFALVALDVIFEADLAANIAFGNAIFDNPPATSDMRGIIELATVEEAKAGVDALRALTPAAAKAAILDWLGYTPLNVAGGTVTGPFAISHAGDPGILINSEGSVIGLLAAQADGNVVLYRDVGAGKVAVWAATADGFNVASPLTRQGHTVWDAGNHGAFSNLDAGLLAGQRPGWYTDIIARLGFTPLNRAGDTVTGPFAISHAGNPQITINSKGVIIARLAAQADGNIVLYRDDGSGSIAVWGATETLFDVHVPMKRQGNMVWDAGNDGTDSGLDADLLDGQHGDFYTNIVARLGYTPLNVDAYSAADVLAKLRSVDGAGSDVDADMLDGQHGAFYTDIAGRLGYTPMNAASYNDFLRATAGNINTDGFVLLSNDMKIMRGEFTINKDSFAYVTFPHAFDSPPAVVFPTAGGGGDVSFSQNLALTGTTATGFTAWQSGDVTVTTSYIAIGA